jgi:hypothetical protein
MRRAIRLGVIVAVTLASSAWTGARADEGPSATNGTTDQAVAMAQPDPTYELFEPGAASAEPAQALEESPGANDHLAWVQAIWNSP